MLTVTSIEALKDNYIWVIHVPKSSKVIIVDPGESAPVETYLQKYNLSLSAILLTHHHWDHVSGVPDLIAQNRSIKVFGPRHEKLPFVTDVVIEGDIVCHEDINLEVMHIPAHTLEHVAYFNTDMIFTGDTLFGGGCGRIFEGTPLQMYNALLRICTLSPHTQVFCGHEYTVNNLLFASLVEPYNAQIKDRLIRAQELRDLNKPTLPSTIALEINTNPFLRTGVAAVVESAEKQSKTTLNSPVTVLAALRTWKNNF